MADLLTGVAVGFYAWTTAAAGRAVAGAATPRTLTTKITNIPPRIRPGVRIAADLGRPARGAGEQVSRKTVAKLMRSNGIVGISPRGWTPITTVPGPGCGQDAGPGRPTLRPRPAEPGAGPPTSPTWPPARAGCTCARSATAAPAGSSAGRLRDHLRADLVDQALTMAVVFRGQRPAKVVFHADRGTQGGFNWSSQHLERGGVDGQASWVDDGVDGTVGDEVAGSAVRIGGRWSGRSGSRSPRGLRRRTRRTLCRRVAGGRWPVVPPRWRHDTVRACTAVGPVPVVR